MPSPPQPKDAPFDYNFGLPPEEVPHDWEFNEGTDAFTRVSKVGASNIQFLERIGAEDTGDDQKWKAVAKLGADHMKITKGTVVDDERKEIEREKKARLNNGGDPTSDEEKEANASDSDSDSDSSSSDEEDATLHPSDAPTETQEDENNMLDNDWDTSEWSMQEIESACGTLITECEKNSNIKRQELSIRMLLRLLDRHQEAVNYLTKVSGRSDRERSESEARAKRERSESEARAKRERSEHIELTSEHLDEPNYAIGVRVCL